MEIEIMLDGVGEIQALVEWYEQVGRSFLKDMVSEEKLADFDKDCARLSRSARVCHDELAVCFLGSSGIGKSTLINSLLGGTQAVVPSGGVGPLTAQAVVVRHAERPGFEVEYHGSARLWRTIFGLERAFKAELGAPADALSTMPEIVGLDESDLPDEDGVPVVDEVSEGEAQRRDRREQLRRRAQLMITGSQEEERDLRYLLDSLREAAGYTRIWGTQPEAQDAGRIQGIKEALSFAKDGRKQVVHGAAESEDFKGLLHDHATGYLAPLIESLTVHWQSPLLAGGVTLVDLPGVGVVRDVHKDVTRKWVREKAQALVLVVDHRGMTESLAESLKRSEFLNTLLYSADEPEDDPIVLVAVTRIDDVAQEAYRSDKSRKKFEHFHGMAEAVRERLRNDLQRYLKEIWLEGAEASEARKQVVENLLNTLQVHPLSAPEYAKFLADDEDDAPFLKEVGQTGVPGFIDSLTRLASTRRERALARLREQSTLFHERVVTTLRLTEAQWENEGRAEEEAERLREDLDHFMRPRRDELHVRQGAYRTFLKKGVPQRIEDLVAVAKGKAAGEINRYLTTRLWSSHWATLRASVRRGGRYSGASDINLPTVFALSFEAPVAEVWSKQILQDIRRETKAYANDCIALVEEVADWALDQGARVQANVVEAQRDAIRVDAKRLESVGREMVKEMRDEAKAQLIEVIEGPIKKSCTEFVRQNKDVGPGVKQRILELYGGLAEKVTDAAEEPARRILLKLFREVEKEIVDAFADHQNPLDSVAEAIVSSQRNYLERSDAQKRKQVLRELRAVMDALPGRAQAAVVGG